MACSLQLTYSTVVGEKTNNSLSAAAAAHRAASINGVFFSTRRQTNIWYLDLKKRKQQRGETKLRAFFLFCLSYII